MLKTKEILLFDTDKIKVKSFITYHYFKTGDEGEAERDRLLNGIVVSVGEEKIVVLKASTSDKQAKYDEISIEEVRKGLEEDVNGVVIVGTEEHIYA